jgi:hypothetical protein
MHTLPSPAHHACPKHRMVAAAILALLLIPLSLVRAQGTPGSNTQPLAFGPDQVIIDLNKLVWVPLKAEGVPPGPEMAVLRGDGKAPGFEVMVRLPTGYTFPNHSHTSDEHYWGRTVSVLRGEHFVERAHGAAWSQRRRSRLEHVTSMTAFPQVSRAGVPLRPVLPAGQVACCWLPST